MKFRVWDFENKKMKGKDIVEDWKLPFLNQEGVMQYTGLKDKNGKEIYEGDIVGYSNNIGADRVIRWNAMEAGFNIRATAGRNKSFYKIKGNIYENPELLNKI